MPEIDTSATFEGPDAQLTRSPRRRFVRTATPCSSTRRRAASRRRAAREARRRPLRSRPRSGSRAHSSPSTSPRIRARSGRPRTRSGLGIGSGPVRINDASYEQLRQLGLSVTQTGRVLAYRERVGGFSSLDDLDQIPGFPGDFLTELKTKLEL